MHSTPSDFTVMKLLLLILFFSSLHRFSSGVAVEYYLVNQGLEPTKLEDATFSYDAFLSNGKPSEKRICAYWTVHRKVEQLGLNIDIDRRVKGTNSVIKSGEKIPIKSVCKTEFPMEPFLEKFNGTIDKNCSLLPGFYYIDKWTFEDHMKKIIPKMILGEYIIHLCWLEKEKGCIMKNDIFVELRSLQEKGAEDRIGNVKDAKKEKKGGKDKKDKKGKKGKLPEQPEMPTMPENGGKMPTLPDKGGKMPAMPGKK